jgi:uncharacterized membrane protein YfcA
MTGWIVSSESELWVFVPIMTALALVGVVLAGHFEAGIFHYAGYALFVVSILWIFLAIKAYFDARERGDQPHHHH